MRKKSGRSGQPIESLPIAERIGQYREMADAAYLKARKALNPTQQSEYLNMAASWHALAQELERTESGPAQSPIAQEQPPTQPQEAD
ncbi:MAG TPA: hypothetical protein VFI23_08015 [Rhizomicrobium sp.]|nr:hypothetical protein [Rhizomicrobium sp.]